MTADTVAPDPAKALEPCSNADLARYFLRLGATGFGGPVALAGAMQRDLVEQRRWIAKQDYVEGLALAQLAPGPLAAQLAIYLGWVRGGVLGATIAGVAFVLPAFVMVVALAELYVRLHGLGGIQAVFYGVGAAVIAAMVRSAVKLARVAAGRDALRWSIFAVSCATTAWTEREILSVFIGAGLVEMLVRAPPRRGGTVAALEPSGLALLLRGLHGLADASTLSRIFIFFAESGAVVFGSGLAVVPFLHGGVVNELHWLDERQFLDAVAVAMITPGPVVITVAFIGYLVAGAAGALLAAAGVFLPCYVIVIAAAPYYRKLARNPQIKAFVAGVTAAATGAIAGATIVLGRRALIDVPTVLIGLGALLVLTKLKRVPEPVVFVIAALVGLAIHATGGH